MQVDDFDCLYSADIDLPFLQSNSTSHAFLLGAFAELADNARDADATSLRIFTEKMPDGQITLSFLDDGCGMSQDELLNAFELGTSAKRNDSRTIGMFGNGLKSGAMRIGNDLLVLTKKDGVYRCLMLSRTFLMARSLNKLLLPWAEYDAATLQPRRDDRLRISESVIFEYSPMSRRETLFDAFRKLAGPSGTLICVFNLFADSEGRLEIDLADPTDIRVASVDNEPKTNKKSNHCIDLMRTSLRNYMAYLYKYPKMKIYIQGHKVCTQRIESLLCNPRKYRYNFRRFQEKFRLEVEQLERQLKQQSTKVASYDALTSDETKIDRQSARELRIRLARQRARLEEARRQVEEELVAKQKAKNRDVELEIIFGLHIDNRDFDGCFVYSNGRLISFNDRTASQHKGNHAGVVAVIDIPYSVVELNHNKQSFREHKEYDYLKRVMGIAMNQYWIDCGIENEGVDDFWKKFGYDPVHYERGASKERQFVKKRAMAVSRFLQCDKCLSWRRLRVCPETVPDSWSCQDNKGGVTKCSQFDDDIASFPVGQIQRRDFLEEDLALGPAIDTTPASRRLSNGHAGNGMASATLNWPRVGGAAPVAEVMLMDQASAQAASTACRTAPADAFLEQLNRSNASTLRKPPASQPLARPLLPSHSAGRPVPSNLAKGRYCWVCDDNGRWCKASLTKVTVSGEVMLKLVDQNRSRPVCLQPNSERIIWSKTEFMRKRLRLQAANCLRRAQSFDQQMIGLCMPKSWQTPMTSVLNFGTNNWRELNSQMDVYEKDFSDEAAEGALHADARALALQRTLVALRLQAKTLCINTFLEESIVNQISALDPSTAKFDEVIEFYAGRVTASDDTDLPEQNSALTR